MHIIIREPIALECGQLFTRHLSYMLHSINVEYSSKGINAMSVNPQVVSLDANGVDTLLDAIAQHHSGDKTGVTLMRESAGYYVLQVYHD